MLHCCSCLQVVIGVNIAAPPLVDAATSAPVLAAQTALAPLLSTSDSNVTAAGTSPLSIAFSPFIEAAAMSAGVPTAGIEVRWCLKIAPWVGIRVTFVPLQVNVGSSTSLLVLTPPPTTQSAQSTQDSTGTWPPGQLAGLILGCLVICGVIVAVVYCTRCKCCRGMSSVSTRCSLSPRGASIPARNANLQTLTDRRSRLNRVLLTPPQMRLSTPPRAECNK